MSDNPKNLIQEWCQKNNTPLPKYQTEITTQMGGNNLFTTTISVNRQHHRGPVRYSKKEAEMAVAEIAWLNLQKHCEQRRIIYDGPVTTILIDVENKPKIIEEVFNMINVFHSPHLIVVGVLANNHPLALRDSGIWKQIRTSLLKVNSVRSDASDTWLTFLAGKLLAQGLLGQRCLVISQDHFSETLVECLREHGIDSQTAVTFEQISNFLGLK